MKIRQTLLLLCFIVISNTPARAQLPICTKKPWLGYFVGSDRRNFMLGILADGSGNLEIKDSKGTPMGFTKGILISPSVMVEGDKGWINLKKIPNSLTTNDQASETPSKVSYRGKVTGGAEFEVKVEFDRDKISFGGRILDKGTTTKPMKFQIRIRFQQPYQKVDPIKDKAKLLNDEIKFIRFDNKKDKCGVLEDIDFADEKKFGPLKAIEVIMKAYGKPRLLFNSAGQTPIVLQNPRNEAMSPLKGFAIVYEHDPVKDPNGNDRLVFEVK